MDDAYRLISAFFDSTSAGLALMDAEPHLADARTGLGETPLHYLAVENQLEAVKALVERGVPVNTVSDVNGTPLSEAAQLGYVDLVKFLLTAGADVSMPGQEEPTIIAATRSGNSEIVKALIEAGADVNATDSLNETALHVAAKKNYAALIKVLLDAGADVNAQALFGETPLDFARKKGATDAEAELTR